MSEGILFERCAWSDIAETVANNLRAHAIHVDSYWEEHVTDSNHYRMLRGEETVGYFAIHQESTLTLFWVAPKAAAHAQALFARAKQYEQVTAAMLPTGDEFFLSHAVDNFVRMEKQAYFSCYLEDAMPGKPCAPVTLRLADLHDPADLATLALSGDFLKPEIEKALAGTLLNLHIYVAELDGEPVGFGVVERSRLLPENCSVGMYVLEERRQRGVGTGILRALVKAERAAGFSPRSGCWYYNHQSKKTQECAGAYMPTRLLRFYF